MYYLVKLKYTVSKLLKISGRSIIIIGVYFEISGHERDALGHGRDVHGPGQDAQDCGCNAL